MKNLFVILIMTFLSAHIFGQDLIITNDNDSIICKIMIVKKQQIYFKHVQDDMVRDTSIALSLVKSYTKDYTMDDAEEKSALAASNSDYPRFRLMFNAGLGYSLAGVSNTVPDDFRNYVNELRTGTHYNAEFTYFFKEVLGLGVKYDMYTTSNRIDEIYMIDEFGNITYGAMSDDISVSYFGPSLSFRLFDKKMKNSLVAGISVGYVSYNNNVIIIDDYSMKGGTVGVQMDFGYDIKISKELIVGVQVSTLNATLTAYDWDDGETVEKVVLDIEEWESLSRMNFSAGIRFSF